ncbi:alpha/beta hydrolase [uncultured Lamprocystis sp.]|jgi:esterase/lipase superfamily enzyme|uniref:alpha/beta hydrolase n=1 Tax=uncultured Lamprocystis sp. TaxID=543132 RepID=UPI0025F8D38A|nr:alpha/beta hydrolase [uncultured Lamprocystis sp.]
MPRARSKVLSILTAVLLLAGCATPLRQLMPTPIVYQQPGGLQIFAQAADQQLNPNLDLIYITDRGPETDPESTLPYGQTRARRITFGTTQVRLTPAITWNALLEQSQRGQRTRAIGLELGTTKESGHFPDEPYQLHQLPNGLIERDRAEMARHQEAKQTLSQEIERRLKTSSSKKILLYVHGFNETFASAAYTTAELCHFLGREDVCTFFTWPASSTGNFLTSYTTTTESADYAVEHLKKTIRLLARVPGVEGLQLLAHSRGTAVMLRAVRELGLEAISAGQEPMVAYRIDNLVLMSPDIDVDIAGQQITGFLSDPDLVTVWPEGRLPRMLKGRMTIYASPEDRALRVSKFLFRSRNRMGQLRPEDLPPKTRTYFATLGKLDLITYQGDRTDFFGHSYFTTNPQVSSDLIQMIRYGKKPGEPGRELVQTSSVTWRFPTP